MEIFETIEDMLEHIKERLDAKKGKKASIIYAYNASGKTRMSKLFHDKHGKKVLLYNAFIEDLFNWDNEDISDGYALKINENALFFNRVEEQKLDNQVDELIFKTMDEHGLDKQIMENFQRFTGSKIEFDAGITESKKIIFRIYSNELAKYQSIKISRAEESVFIWSIFYTVLAIAIEALNKDSKDRTTNLFDNVKYVIIDDPVSSMDDTRIITIALELSELIASSKSELKFLITTHHALFFNILFNNKNKEWNKENYILSKTETETETENYILKTQGRNYPFAYHHAVISDIKRAIKNKNIKKYHFNLFRALLEKTANFLGYPGGWDQLLPKEYNDKRFIKFLNHYSHDSLSDLEPKHLIEDDKKDFKKAFFFFLEDFQWKIGKKKSKKRRSKSNE